MVEIETSTSKKADERMVQELRDQVSDQIKLVEETERAFSSWRGVHNGKINNTLSLNLNCNKLQRRLKAMCAKVRNEYITKCPQEDFITGLKEMYKDACPRRIRRRRERCSDP